MTKGTRGVNVLETKKEPKAPFRIADGVRFPAQASTSGHSGGLRSVSAIG